MRPPPGDGEFADGALPMNLLLLEVGELDAEGRVRLTGRRADHLWDVLRVVEGQVVRVGVLDGPRGSGTVVGRAKDAGQRTITLAVDLTEPPEPPGSDWGDVLFLALPRPPVLSRCLAEAAALGFARIVLFRSARVEKSYLDSRSLAPAALRLDILLGLEQAGRTRVPEVRVEPDFPAFLDRLSALASPGARILAHPGGQVPLERLPAPRDPFTVVIGPEGGFRAEEVSHLEARGFLPVTLGPHPLRVSTAFSTVASQLQLLRRLDQCGRLRRIPAIGTDPISTDPHGDPDATL